jgi:hypothetical protein
VRGVLQVIRPTTALAAVAAAAALAAAPASAPAVVPPRDCGDHKIRGKKYQVKVDQVSCRDGIAFTRRYLEQRRKPRGYTCDRRSTKVNQLRFICRNFRASPVRQFYAIRRR